MLKGHYVLGTLHFSFTFSPGGLNAKTILGRIVNASTVLLALEVLLFVANCLVFALPQLGLRWFDDHIIINELLVN